MFIRFLFLMASLPFFATAATLTQVPMQGGMVMPMISYQADHGHLQVMMPPEIPQLTPLLISNPGDNFDPANPWFNDLDPGAKGLSFSRRYGFVMDTETDPLPSNTVIWIRKLSGPPELKFFRYATSPAPGAWEPIYGTGGSPAARMWNGMMFHPAVTAPPGTNGYVAVFEAYLVNTDTMEEVPDSSTGPMNLYFTNVPDGRAELAIGMAFAIQWDGTITKAQLQSTTSLESGIWTDVTNQPTIINGQNTVLLPVGPAAGLHYRTRQP